MPDLLKPLADLASRRVADEISQYNLAPGGIHRVQCSGFIPLEGYRDVADVADVADECEVKGRGV
jgi:hypothetical protein